jgi:transcriptional regulator with XRE-family HTH domain
VPIERPEAFVLRVTRRIGEIRRERGLTQDAVAEALGTATRAFQRIEAGQNLTLFTLARIAAVLGVSPEALLAHDANAGRMRYAASRSSAVHAVAERKPRRPRKSRRG